MTEEGLFFKVRRRVAQKSFFPSSDKFQNDFLAKCGGVTYDLQGERSRVEGVLK